jgi:ferredoxin
MYRVTIDREACDGVFACLVRDERFVEDGDGLAAFDTADDAATIEVDDAATLAATFDDDRRGAADQAAAACPLDAISVEEVDAANGASGEPEEVQP